MSTQENVQIVKDVFAAFGRGDKQGLLALSAEDIEWITPGEGRVRQIRPYLDVLRLEWELDQNTFTLARDLEKPIHAFLEQGLSGKDTDEIVTKLVRRGVKVELDT